MSPRKRAEILNAARYPFAMVRTPWPRSRTAKELAVWFEDLMLEDHGVVVDRKGRRVWPATPSAVRSFRNGAKLTFPSTRDDINESIPLAQLAIGPRQPIHIMGRDTYRPSFDSVGRDDCAHADSDPRLRSAI